MNERGNVLGMVRANLRVLQSAQWRGTEHRPEAHPDLIVEANIVVNGHDDNASRLFVKPAIFSKYNYM